METPREYTKTEKAMIKVAKQLMKGMPQDIKDNIALRLQNALDKPVTPIDKKE